MDLRKTKTIAYLLAVPLFGVHGLILLGALLGLGYSSGGRFLFSVQGAFLLFGFLFLLALFLLAKIGAAQSVKSVVTSLVSITLFSVSLFIFSANADELSLVEQHLRWGDSYESLHGAAWWQAKHCKRAPLEDNQCSLYKDDITPKKYRFNCDDGTGFCSERDVIIG